MNNMEIQRKLLRIVTGFILLSGLLLIGTFPGIFMDPDPGSNPTSASIGVLLAIIIRLIIFYAFVIAIREMKKGRPLNKALTIVLGCLLLLFGLILLDGAFAFQGHESILYVSVLMFICIFCDCAAALTSFAALFIKTEKANS